MRKILKFDMGVGIISSASVGGREESCGPLCGRFDITDKDDLFGMESWEMAEGEMCRLALGTALKKCGITADDIDLLLAGDLENQCVASSLGLYTFGIPYLGLYAACSTATEALLIASSMISSGEISRAATVTSSHNCAAERQFRTPIEYGALRTPTAQWTATAAGAFILDKKKKGTPYISEAMIGKIIDGCTSDGANMGAAMSRAAFDSVYTYFSASGRSISEFDAIFTGDLGRVGSEIFCDLIEREIPGAASIHFPGHHQGQHHRPDR